MLKSVSNSSSAVLYLNPTDKNVLMYLMNTDIGTIAVPVAEKYIKESNNQTYFGKAGLEMNLIWLSGVPNFLVKNAAWYWVLGQ